MLFTFNIFWKTLGGLILAWVAYGFLGFEFTVVSLLSLLLIQQICDDRI